MLVCDVLLFMPYDAQAPNDPRSTGESADAHQVSVGMNSNKESLQCHATLTTNVASHTKHQTGSSGTLCYNCHLAPAAQTRSDTKQDKVVFIFNFVDELRQIAPATERETAPLCCPLCHEQVAHKRSLIRVATEHPAVSRSPPACWI